MLEPSKNCIDLIKKYEGYHTALPNGDCKAYRDPGSADGLPYTIGWGTTQYRAGGLAKYGRARVMLTDTLTRAEADGELEAAIRVFAGGVNKLSRQLSQSQFDAAVSFFYNTGLGNKQAERIRSGDFKAFEVMLPAYNKGGDGKVLQGLVRRRADELAMWRNGAVAKVGWIALTLRKDKYILSAMDGDTVRHEHEWKSTAQLISLLRQYPEAGTTVVTKEGWESPVNGIVAEEPQVAHATLVKTTTRLPNNLVLLHLKIGGETIPCVSGQGYAQNFRRPSDPRSVPGNMEPIPQGKYIFGREEWAGAPGDWSKSHGAGLGPVWIGLSATFSDDRGSFGCHYDPPGAPGSAGCVVFQTKEATEQFLAALRKHKPRHLVVDWGIV